MEQSPKLASQLNDHYARLVELERRTREAIRRSEALMQQAHEMLMEARLARLQSAHRIAQQADAARHRPK